MKRFLLGATFVTAIAMGGVVAAQAPVAKPDEHAAHHPGGSASGPATPGRAPTADAKATKGAGMSGDGMMCGQMMGGGMMGGGMMGGGMGPMMMGGPNTKVDVKKIDKGITITLTSPDAATAGRLQKMAEAMRLMHEATAP